MSLTCAVARQRTSLAVYHRRTARQPLLAAAARCERRGVMRRTKLAAASKHRPIRPFVQAYESAPFRQSLRQDGINARDHGSGKLKETRFRRFAHALRQPSSRSPPPPCSRRRCRTTAFTTSYIIQRNTSECEVDHLRTLRKSATWQRSCTPVTARNCPMAGI
jgi:hypothetical protein